MADLEISPADTAAAVADDSAIIVDVREQAEREAGHIAGSIHIPLNEVSGQAASLPRDKTIVFQCRVGGRSTMAAMAFADAGYDARTMTGGLVAWVDEDRPLVPEGGVVADH